METNIITGIAIVNDVMGKKIVFTYSVVDGEGNIKDNNKKQSYLPLDPETKDAIQILENCVYKKLGANAVT